MAQLVQIKEVTVGPKDLDALVEIAPNAPLMTSEDIEATARIARLMPELADHVCTGDAGRLFRDSMGHTELAHLLEHITVELLARTNIAGDITCGRTYPVADNERAFDVVFPCPDDVLVTSALSSAVWIMQWAFTGGGEPQPDVDAIVGGIVDLVQSVSEPVQGEEEPTEQGVTQEERREPVAENDTLLAEEAPIAEEPAAATAPAPPASLEPTSASPAEKPAQDASAVANESLGEPDDVAEDSQPGPGVSQAPVPDDGDWDMTNMPRPRPVR